MILSFNEMAKLKKPNFSSNKPGNKSRKQLRKEKRLGKKERKNEHYKNKFLISNLRQKNETTDSKMQTSTKTIKKKLRKQKTQQPEKDCDERSPGKLDTQALQKLNHTNEINLKRKLEKDMKKQRKIQLLEENKYEDKEIKKLEKQLKMNKRKSKTLPKCFIEEGLDYILNVCDSDGMKNILDNQESDSEFVDDLAMVKGEKPAKRAKTSSTTKTPSEDTDSDEEMSDDFDDDDDDDDDDGPLSEDDGGVDNSDDDYDDDDGDDQEEEEDDDIDEPQRLKNTKSPKNVPVKSQAEDEDLSCVVDKSENGNEMDMNEDFDDDGDLDAAEGDCDAKGEQKDKSNGKGKYWQDIYGRQRDEKGNIVQSEGKYIPPHLKAKMLGESSERKERLARLSRQLKGHINRLAENNMHRIVTEMDQLYMQNSRNDMNETLTKLIFESLIQPFLIPERLISEHTMLIAALHANVGTEVGAFFLQDLIEKFDETLKKGLDEDKKDLDNILLVISYLYIYKVCHSVLIYDILDRICSRNSLGEKEVELLLVVLRSAGFCLRKDDPLALKNLIMKIETQASSVANNSRVKFMLSVLRAIKNNNTTKVPQYDANRYDHLRKILKTVVQKGKYISELKISLEDLLNAESRGRWWIVGSAWARDSKDEKEDRELPAASAATSSTSFTSKLLDLAKKQRMNTDARRNIFCILMSAEDYLDAFEKLLKLGLKGQQEQEIFNVIMHCSIQEKTYNPYYAYLVARLCTCNRKFVMMFQYHLWDRFKELKDLKRFQITNMAKLLAHLLLQNLLPLSALKVIEFASLERPSVRLLRQLFLTVLLSDNEEDIATVFSRISQPPKLHIFRESIRLFFHQFLLKHQPDSVLLKNRIQMAESLLMGMNINENLNSKMF